MPDTAERTLEPRWAYGMTREEAAAYLRIGTTTFDKLVDEGHLPKPVPVPGTRLVRWHRAQIEAAFEDWAGAPDTTWKVARRK